MISTAPSTSAPSPEADALVPLEQPHREHRRWRSPIGRLTKKIQCQLMPCVSTPPSSRPDRASGGGDEAVDADRLGLLPGLREHRDDHAQDHGGGHGAADALEEARAHEQLLALRDAAEQRRHGEDHQPGEEHVPPGDEVSEPSRQQEQPAEGDQVGVDDPGQARLREAEVLLDRGQRDVHDRRVEDDHQHARRRAPRGRSSASVRCPLRGSSSALPGREGGPRRRPAGNGGDASDG